MTPGEHVALVGLMGVGKSRVGRLLADRWGRPFVDLDRAVERRAGTTVARVFAERGEPAFRRLEAAVLEEVLAADEPGVLSCGGGVVTTAANRTALGDRATVVWLTATVDALARRVGDGSTRPLLGADPAAALRALAAEREPLYGEVADHVIDTTDRPPEAVADLVAEAVA